MQLLSNCTGTCALPEWMSSMWVIASSPITASTVSVDWIVATDPSSLTLSIYARNVLKFQSQFNSTVVAIALADGFSQCYNTPIAVDQGNSCQYSSVPIPPVPPSPPSGGPTSKPSATHAMSNNPSSNPSAATSSKPTRRPQAAKQTVSMQFDMLEVHQELRGSVFNSEREEDPEM